MNQINATVVAHYDKQVTKINRVIPAPAPIFFKCTSSEVQKNFGELEEDSEEDLNKDIFRFLKEAYSLLKEGVNLQKIIEKTHVTIRRLILLTHGKYPGFEPLERGITNDFINKIYKLSADIIPLEGRLSDVKIYRLARKLGIDFTAVQNAFGEGKELFSLLLSRQQVVGGIQGARGADMAIYWEVYHRLLAGQSFRSAMEEIRINDTKRLEKISDEITKSIIRKKGTHLHDIRGHQFVPVRRVIKLVKPSLDIVRYTFFVAKEGIPKTAISDILEDTPNWLLIRILHGRYRVKDTYK
jgi:hypothetical protein